MSLHVDSAAQVSPLSTITSGISHLSNFAKQGISSAFDFAKGTLSQMMGGGGAAGTARDLPQSVGGSEGLGEKVLHGAKDLAELGVANLVPGLGEVKDAEMLGKLGGDVMKGAARDLSPHDEAAQVTSQWAQHEPLMSGQPTPPPSYPSTPVETQRAPFSMPDTPPPSNPSSPVESRRGSFDGGEQTTARDLPSSGGGRGILDQVGQAVSGVQGKISSAQTAATAIGDLAHGSGNSITAMGNTSVNGDMNATSNTLVNSTASQYDTQMQTQAKLTSMQSIFQMVTNALSSIATAVRDAWSKSAMTQ